MTTIVALPELLRGNEYESVVSLQTNPNLIGTPVRRTDIGHEVTPGRFASITRLATEVSGHILFVGVQSQSNLMA